MSPDEHESAPAAPLIVMLLAFSAVAYLYHSAGPSGPQEIATIANLQVSSASVTVSGLHRSSLSLDLTAVVFNPNPFGATLEAATYSVYANGRYLGTDQTPHGYDLGPESSQTFTFPISIGWGSALDTTAIYLTSLGNVSWKVYGTATINLGGLAISAPFQFRTG